MSEIGNLLAEVSGLAPEVAASLDVAFEQPEFTFEAKSTLKIPGAEQMNGTVVMKFPNTGDSLKIERVTRALGGSQYAHMLATLAVCIVRAPASWYELKEGQKAPMLNLERLPDDVVLADAFGAFLNWQRTFR